MLKFTCTPDIRDSVIDYFVMEFVQNVIRTNLQTLACNHYDKNLEEEVRGLITETDTGFIFDEQDQIGDEPYGYVSDFFECYLIQLENLKTAYPTVGIDGHVFVNDLGPYECTMRQRVHTNAKMTKVNFIDQLQCVNCCKWVDVKDAHTLLEDDDIEVWPEDDGEPMYPSAYSNSGVEAAFCLCSQECAEDFYE